MKQFYRLFFLCVFTTSLIYGQKKTAQYIVNNTAAIRSIDVADTNYTDLAVIGNAIGKARVVMLGEQDHGDAPAFQAKARLIRYLHEQLGFTVLAFESDFFGLTAGYDAVIQRRLSIDILLSGNIFPMWTLCSQFSGIQRYIISTHQTGNQLQVAGIDNQFHGQYANRYFTKELDSFLRASGIPFVKSAAYTGFLTLADTLVYYSGRQQVLRDTIRIQALLSQTDTVLSQLKQAAIQDHFRVAAIESFRSACKDQLYRRTGVYADRFVERDKQMARNLTWLLQVKYPQEKIIVWAANGHITRDALTVLTPATARHHSLGNFFTLQPELSATSYVLGFTSYQGKAGRIGMETYNLPPVEKNSFEQWLKQKNYPYAFVDFQPLNNAMPRKNERFYMEGESHYPLTNTWTTSFDGIFFIRDMFPCDKTP